MRSVCEDRPDLARPALIVTYGTTSKKYRALERDVVVVGRAPGCDVALASPEVAPIHCVLARGPHGWRVRDCSGRGGTRINGTPVVDGALKDGDTLQVGAFSFEAHLPAGEQVAPPEAGVPTDAAPVAEAVPVVRSDDQDRRDQEHRLEIRAKELMLFGEHLRRQEQEVNARLALRHEEVARAESTLREQRAEVVRRMTEMARAGQAAVKVNKSDSAARQDAEAMRAQLAMVKQELAGRDSIIAGLRVRLEQLERELGAHRPFEEERQELQKQRDELGERIAQLEERRADLEEALREAELQAARERAQLARDRTELERMLDDFRFEQQTARRSVDAFGSVEGVARITTDVVGPPPVLRVVVPDRGSAPGTAKWIDFAGDRDAE